ncbi:MAG: glycosyltransferase family 39 protein [Candidatus Omnitrophica bacterium]|nr:glycosyltransferase family 39 protein [Candidatus Omnitrophota bacterium]
MKKALSAIRNFIETIGGDMFLLTGAIMAGFGLRVFNFYSKIPQDGEIAICYLANFEKFGDLLKYLQGVNQNLLYLSTLHFWFMLLGSKSIIWGRVLLVLSGSIVIILVYILGRRLFDKKIAILASWLVALSPVLIANSRTLEGYSFICMMVLISEYFFVKCFIDKECNSWNTLFYFLFSVIRFYGHPYCISISLAEGLFLLSVWRRDRLVFRKWFLINVFVFLAAIPNFLILWKQYTNQTATLLSEYALPTWRTEVGLKKILMAIPSLISNFGYIITFHYDRPFIKYLKLINLSFVLLLLSGLFKRGKRADNITVPLRYLLFLVFVPIVSIFPMAFLSYGHYTNSKYFVFIAPYLYLLASVGILSFRNTLQKVLIAVIAFLAIVSAAIYLIVLPRYEVPINWHQLAVFLKSEIKEDDLVLVFPSEVTFNMNYGMDKMKPIPLKGIPEDFKFETLATESNRIANPGYADSIAKAVKGYNAVWLLTWYEEDRDPKKIVISSMEKDFELKKETLWASSNGNFRVRLYVRRPKALNQWT